MDTFSTIFYSENQVSLLMHFGMPFGCLLYAPWMSSGVRDVPGAHFGDFMNLYDFRNVPGAKK